MINRRDCPQGQSRHFTHTRDSRAWLSPSASCVEFPDAADPTRACYQGIIEAQATINGFRGAGFTDTPYEVRITSYASHPFPAELGLKEGWQGVGQGVWMDFDFEQHLGAEDWRAG